MTKQYKALVDMPHILVKKGQIVPLDEDVYERQEKGLFAPVKQAKKKQTSKSEDGK